MFTFVKIKIKINFFGKQCLLILHYLYFIILANNHGNERLTVTETKSTLPQSDLIVPSNTGSAESDSSIDLDSMHLMLEPNLRPATPDPNSRVSQQIFEEHKDLAKEYLKVRHHYNNIIYYKGE